MKIAVIGPGNVGQALGRLALRGGHEVFAGVRDVDSPSAARVRAEMAGAQVLDVAAAARAAELLLLTVPFGAAVAAVRDLGDLGGRILVDCTNPVGPGLTHAGGAVSGASMLAEAAVHARVVKCFNVYGVENLGDPAFPGAPLPGMMPVAGDDPAARRTVMDLAASMGWQPVDVGGLVQALHLEHLALLWIRMVRVNGESARFVWARVGEG